MFAGVNDLPSAQSGEELVVANLIHIILLIFLFAEAPVFLALFIEGEDVPRSHGCSVFTDDTVDVFAMCVHHLALFDVGINPLSLIHI